MITYGNLVIYENLKEIINPEHTAVVVWDVQNAMVDRIFNRDEFLQNLKRFIASAREAGVPLLYSRVVVPPEGYDSSWRIFIQMRRFGISDPARLMPWLAPNTPQWEIAAEVSPLPGEAVIDKHTASLFIGTQAENLLRNRGIKTLLFTGLLTEAGVESSARESSNRGFYTIVIEDCVSSIDKQTHDLALSLMKKNFMLLVASSLEVAAQWPQVTKTT